MELPELVAGVFEALPDGVLVADDQGAILHVNGQLLEWTGNEQAELLAAPTESLVPIDVRSDARVPGRDLEGVRNPGRTDR